jgi:hypothetical protein
LPPVPSLTALPSYPRWRKTIKSHPVIVSTSNVQVGGQEQETIAVLLRELLQRHPNSPALLAYQADLKAHSPPSDEFTLLT